MGEHPVPKAPRSNTASASARAADPPLRRRSSCRRLPTRVAGSARRTCKVCAPLREKRRLSKAQRKADAQAQAHAKGEPCGRNNCPVPVCVGSTRRSGDCGSAAQRADEPNDAATGASSTDREAPSRPVVWARDLRQPRVRRRLRARARPTPPGSTAVATGRCSPRSSPTRPRSWRRRCIAGVRAHSSGVRRRSRRPSTGSRWSTTSSPPAIPTSCGSPATPAAARSPGGSPNRSVPVGVVVIDPVDGAGRRPDHVGGGGRAGRRSAREDARDRAGVGGRCAPDVGEPSNTS